MVKLSIIGNGYTAQFLSKEALKKGLQVSIITRNISKPKKNIHYFNYYDSKNIAEKLCKENIISTVPPNEEGLDPVIQNYGKSIALNKNKIIYFSATSVYGEGETDEETKPDPKHNRGLIRLNAEEKWIKTNQNISIFRIAGIYGPKRHPMIKYLEGNNKIIIKKDYIPNRIHVEDLSSIAIQFLTKNLKMKAKPSFFHSNKLGRKSLIDANKSAKSSSLINKLQSIACAQKGYLRLFTYSPKKAEENDCPSLRA